MYITACLKCYDGNNDKRGGIKEVLRRSDTGGMDGKNDGDAETCEKCGAVKHYVCTDRGPLITGDCHHVSESLAINPSQAATHRKLFPGIDVLPDGRIGFNSVKQRSDYLQKTGFEKKPQKIKKHGKVISK